MEKERINLYKKLTSVNWITSSGIAKKFELPEDKPLYPGTYDEFLVKYFTNEAGVRDLWNRCLKYDVSSFNFDEFFQKYSCDLAWASKLPYCLSWKNYPCVTNMAAKYGIQPDGSTDSYYIGDYMYYKNGRRFNNKTKKLENYNCNSPELKNFQPEAGATPEAQPIANAAAYKPCTASYTRGCYSEKIKEAQACLGVTADGKFGPNTEAKLKAIGFPNGFTDDDIVTICKGGKNIIKSWMDSFPTCVRGLNPYENGNNSRFYGMGTGSDGKLYHIYYYDKKYQNGLFCQVKSVEDGVEWINGFYACASNDNKINISTLGGLTIEGSVLNPETPKNRPIKPAEKLEKGQEAGFDKF